MKNLIIYYDNWCPNCTRFAKLIANLDWFNLIEIKTLRDTENLEINKELSTSQMASFNGKWNYGYLSLYLIFKRIFIFWLFLPFLYLLHKTGLGQILYMQLAVKRSIIPIHCTTDKCTI